MFILWIRKHDKTGKTKDLAAPQDMKTHNEEMKQFRATHHQIDYVPKRDIVTANGDLLAPVQTVRLSPNVCN